jgi:DNA polymerase I-like protein with 3'-5' exonuclease and polymerase domains
VWQLTVRPSFTQASNFLSSILYRLASGERVRLAHDAETRRGHIACWGIATSPREALCIPFMDLEHREGYWSADEEVTLVGMIRRILTHPNAINVGQNFAYDAQYTALWWACLPQLTHDTMIQQHVAFAGLPKGLDFLSSMYCNFHIYWKDEGKNWDPRTMPEDQLWLYNCRDAIATWESSVELERVIRCPSSYDPRRCH